jgi:tetrahydromethanopterin S-methyltransferase subunit F
VSGFLIGRHADQAQKIIVAGFAAGTAGVLFAGLLMLTGFFPPRVRLLSGVFVASFMAGLVWGWIGFATRRKDSDAD